MRKLFLFVLILFLGLIPVSARAQTDTNFSSVNVQIWPDYDQPSVLVIYHYVLADDIPLPASLDLMVPLKASINAVATSDGTGGLITADYVRKVSGEWTVLAMTSNSRNIQVEYYDNYQLDGQTRQYEYQWPGNYPVDMLTVTLQQPVNVTSIKLDPLLVNSTIAQDGLTYYSEQIGAFEADQSYSLLIEYEKSDNILSASQQSVQPSAPLDGTAEGNFNLTDNLPLILGILGGVLVVGGVVVALYYRNKESTPSTSRKRRRRNTSDGAIGDAYCPQCGKRSQPGDVFCRTCGSRLRRSG